jgi:hypothetical protein
MFCTRNLCRKIPSFASNPLSRWQQKQAIKKQYAAAKHAGQTAGNTAQAASKTGKAARTVKEKVQQAGAFVMRHKKGFLMAGGFVPHYLYADEYHVLLLHDGAEHRFRSIRHHLSVG